MSGGAIGGASSPVAAGRPPEGHRPTWPGGGGGGGGGDSRCGGGDWRCTARPVYAASRMTLPERLTADGGSLRPSCMTLRSSK